MRRSPMSVARSENRRTLFVSTKSFIIAFYQAAFWSVPKKSLWFLTF